MGENKPPLGVDVNRNEVYGGFINNAQGVREMNHMEFAAYESSQLKETPYGYWLEEAEDLLGVDLGCCDGVLNDGYWSKDGCSLDESWDYFKAGSSPVGYADIVKWRWKHPVDDGYFMDHRDIAGFNKNRMAEFE